MATSLHITDELIASRIEHATNRVVLVIPGFFPPVAEAIVQAIARLSPGKVTVISDIDPEACRLGFGEFSSLERVQTALNNAGSMLCHEPGLRIGLLVADSTTLVFSPSARLVEEDKPSSARTNGFELGEPPAEISMAIGLDSASERSIGLDQVPAEQMASVKEELKKNPPIPFNLAQIVRVFNSQLEFVEFGVEKIQLQKVEIEIPHELTGFTNPNLHTLFRFDPGQELLNLKETLEQKALKVQREFTKPAKGFSGSLIKRADKIAFEKEVKQLREEVSTFKKSVEQKIEEVIKDNVAELVKIYAPVVAPKMSTEKLRDLLTLAFRKKLDKTTGSMRVRLLYKGVTYECLKDKDFIEVAKNAFPDLVLSEEFDAARER